jgi:hypothetical protein
LKCPGGTSFEREDAEAEEAAEEKIYYHRDTENTELRKRIRIGDGFP